MNKRICISAVAVLLMVLMVACGGGASPVVGEWVGDSISAGADTTAEELEMMNSMIDLSGFKLSMKKDNTFTMTLATGGAGDSASGNWKEEDGKYILSVPDEAETITVTMENDQLVLDMEQFKIHFKKA